MATPVKKRRSITNTSSNANFVKNAISVNEPIKIDVSPITKARDTNENIKAKDISEQNVPKQHKYSDYSTIASPKSNNYETHVADFNKRRELATRLSTLSGQDLINATKDMSDEDLMRTYYASTAFQDRAYRSLGYKPGDNIPENDLNVINNIIRLGIREGVSGKVDRGDYGKGESVHNVGYSKVSTDDEKDYKRLGSVTAHEMSHSIYNPNRIAPGANAYYTNDDSYNRYGKANAPINLLGINGKNKEHDSAGIENAADSSGLKVQLIRQGIYNMFNSAPMTDEQMLKARQNNFQNRLIKATDATNTGKIIGDIARVNSRRSLEDNGRYFV